MPMPAGGWFTSFLEKGWVRKGGGKGRCVCSVEFVYLGRAIWPWLFAMKKSRILNYHYLTHFIETPLSWQNKIKKRVNPAQWVVSKTGIIISLQFQLVSDLFEITQKLWVEKWEMATQHSINKRAGWQLILRFLEVKTYVFKKKNPIVQ